MSWFITLSWIQPCLCVSRANHYFLTTFQELQLKILVSISCYSCDSFHFNIICTGDILDQKWIYIHYFTVGNCVVPLVQCLLLGSTRTVMQDILYDVTSIPLGKTKEDFFLLCLWRGRKQASLKIYKVWVIYWCVNKICAAAW